MGSRRLEDVFDPLFEDSSDLERQRQARVVLASLDGVDHEDPETLAARKVAEHRFHPRLDIVDGAARIVDPIIIGVNTGDHVWGKFLKDYRPCAAKRGAMFGAFLREEVVEDVGHCLWTFTVPKLLRPFFLHRRELLGELCRAAWESVAEFTAEAAGDDVRRGMAAARSTGCSAGCR